VRPYWERTGIKVTHGDLLAFECGDVGWTVDRPTIELATGELRDPPHPRLPPRGRRLEDRPRHTSVGQDPED
jgi:hypothetical protein